MGGSTVMAGEGGLSALTSLSTLLGVIIATVTIGGLASGAWVKWVAPRLRARRARQEAFEAAILGRPAVLHPDIPGKILAPAVPGIGERQARQEEQMASLVESMSKIADTHARVDGLEVRVTALEERTSLERIAGKVESIQLMKTMETAINADPPDEPRG